MDPAGKFAGGTRSDVLAELGDRRNPLSLSQIRAMTRHLRSLAEPTAPLSAAVLHTYTTELLQPYWRFETALQGLELTLYEAPYGSLWQEVEPASGLRAANPDLIYLFLRWEDLDPAFGSPTSVLDGHERDALARKSAAFVTGLASQLRGVSAGMLVVTILPRMWGPELGAFDLMSPHSDSALRHQIKLEIAAGLREIPSSLFCDLDEIAMQIGRGQMFDARLWETSRFPFSVTGAQAVTQRLVSYAAAQMLPKAKCIVVDADNTLWGGIVGEDGLTGIALGPDYPGSAFVAFQRRLLEFQARGFILALCSKNNAHDVTEVLKDHPHQVLREHHFAGMQINWSAKPDNLRALATQLNLGLESFIFVDDSDHECLAVRQQLPQVTVVQAPHDPLQLPFCLDGVARLEVMSQTDEDRNRPAMYASERMRQSKADTYNDVEEYLASLQMVMRIGRDVQGHVPRIAQLTQKTNQFNLTTRRYTEAQIRSFVEDPDWLVADFSLADIFGDSGIVGVAMIRGVKSADAEWDTLLMSCRVIGRRAEHVFVHQIMRWLAEAGVAQVRAAYLPTAKNEMVRAFWPSVGFQALSAEPLTYTAEVSVLANVETSRLHVVELD